MRLFVAQPVRRLMITAQAALFVVLTAAAASAQAAQQQQQPAAPAAPDALKFAGPGVAMIVNEIKPERAADFEAAWTDIKAGLAAASKPELQQQASSFKIYKLGLELPAGSPQLYIFYIDPIPGVTFDPVKILYESGAFERAKADEIYKKIDGVYARISPWPLVPVVK
jgi:hypothetical protein